MHERIRTNYYKLFILSAVPIGLIVWGLFSYLSYYNSIEAGITTGLLAGGIMTLIIVTIESSIKTIHKELFGNTPVLLAGGANHRKSIEAVGGWLFLTDKELVFKSHQLNIQRHELVIPLGSIQSVEKHDTFGFIQNRLKINTKGESELFVLSGRDRWAEVINKKLESVG